MQRGRNWGGPGHPSSPRSWGKGWVMSRCTQLLKKTRLGCRPRPDCWGACVTVSRRPSVTLTELLSLPVLPPQSDMAGSGLLAVQRVSAAGHFRPLGQCLRTLGCPFRAKPPHPPPAMEDFPGSRGHGCRWQTACQSKPAPVTCRKAAGRRGQGWRGGKGSWGWN